MSCIQEYLLDLVKRYLCKQFSTNEFCEQFTDICNHHLLPSPKSKYSVLLQKICFLCERYSPYDEDISKHGNFFIDENTFQRELSLILSSEYGVL